MLSKDELTRIVAQSCGVTIDVSAFFFEVFINRLSNKLKPGDLLHFHNHGFFHKRNCRIQIEKTSESPTPKSYLIQLVLFSSSSKIRSDLSEIHFLKIPNLKSLWIDDKDFQKSLNAGDFAPYTERNQLIKSFATKAEVIISSLRKDYDSELVDELTIPLTFDLNFLVKRSQKSSGSTESSSKPVTSTEVNDKEAETPIKEDIDSAKKLKPVPGTKEAEEEGLPWNYGTKFLDKEKTQKVDEINLQNRDNVISERQIVNRQLRDSRREQTARLNDFEPVPSHGVLPKDKLKSEDTTKTVKFSVDSNKTTSDEQSGQSNKFTEVKSKYESYRLRDDIRKNKKGLQEKYPSIRSSREKAFTARRNYLPFISIAALVIIVLAVVYIYFFKGESTSSSVDINFAVVKPPPNVNLIERDYDFTVSYPYPKMDEQVELTGINREQLFTSGITPVVPKEIKSEIKAEVKTETNKVNISETENPPVVKEEKTTPPVFEEKTPPVKETKELNDRIFLYRGFYVVYIGTYKSEEAADREADKYFDLGYNAIIEVVENRGRGLEYKLNVGDFTSEEFARQFQEKHLK